MSPKASHPASLARGALRQKILSIALDSKEFGAALQEASSEIGELAKPATTEATIEGAFERILYAQLRDIGLRFHPDMEVGVNLKRHVTRGRMDSRLGALVIEYKRPSLLKTTVQQESALTQLKDYLTSLSETTKSPLIGYLTNGLVACEVHATAGKIVSVSPFEKLTGSLLLRLTKQFISLALVALTPSNLIKDFCGSDSGGVLFSTARALNDILKTDRQPKTEMLFREWEAMFSLAHEDQSQQRRIAERREALSKLFGCAISKPIEEYGALFALHTAYAILLKLMAYRTVSDIQLGQASQEYRSSAFATDTALREFCSELEDGEIFRELGIINLLEGDFFSWYCDKKQWNKELAASVRTVIETLARYESAEHIFGADEAPDLFRELYQAAVPRAVRTSFGEFYTPHWLAEVVLDTAKPGHQWSAIDPCCGSGTFVLAALSRLREECERIELSKSEALDQALKRVAGIDLNPLSVLTARINYFIHISTLLPDELNSPLVIPVFLGDAATVPERTTVGGVNCLSFELKTLKQPIQAKLPVSLISDTAAFMQLMLDYEGLIKSRAAEEAKALLFSHISKTERNSEIRNALDVLTDRLIELEENGWNGIWARILSNFLTTACLGKFSLVIGNPPWIDWKNLPQNYRARLKGQSIVKRLFSGAGRTGGINLNICALISYVSARNWLDKSGRLAFLMPRELANQASYEGWRKLDERFKILEFYDWSNAGHPFDPVKEDFMTFVIGHGEKQSKTIPVLRFSKPRSSKQRNTHWKNAKEALGALTSSYGVAGQIIPNSTSFTFADNKKELNEFQVVAGKSSYIGREGIEFYPQELLLFKYVEKGPKLGTVWVQNIQVQKSKYRIQHKRILLETEYLHPLVKGPEIARFHHEYSGLIVAFPYSAKDPARPIPSGVLRKSSPLLLSYYQKSRETIDQQTKFSDKIRGEDSGEFYGLARTGPYSFADAYVGFRDNSAWCATVVADAKMPWGERKRFVFQNHAVSMCEQLDRSRMIGLTEAHYICAILNTPIVERFIYASSDNRSFKVRPPVLIPQFDSKDERHAKLAKLSESAHDNPSSRDGLRKKCEAIYLSVCQELHKNGASA